MNDAINKEKELYPFESFSIPFYLCIGRNYMDDKRVVELWAMLAMHCSPLLNNAIIKQILSYYSTPIQAIQALNDGTSAWEMLGVTKAQIASFTANKWKEKAEYIWTNIQKYPDINILLSSDEIYPRQLKEIPDPPHILYYQGDITCIAQPTVAVIGTRKASPSGKSIAHNLSKELAEYGFTIVSGLAEGIDAMAHEGALNTNGNTVAVLGNGLDIVYPAKNKNLYYRMKQNGCILTEYPPNTPPKPNHFPIRNRIVSGLSLGVLVVEAGIQSGTMITVKNALEQGRNVYAIPSYCLTLSSTGNSYLLEQGATAVTTAKEIFEDLMPLLLHSSCNAQLTKKLSEHHLDLYSTQKDYLTDIMHTFQNATQKNTISSINQHKSPSSKKPISNCFNTMIKHNPTVPLTIYHSHSNTDMFDSSYSTDSPSLLQKSILDSHDIQSTPTNTENPSLFENSDNIYFTNTLHSLLGNENQIIIENIPLSKKYPINTNQNNSLVELSHQDILHYSEQEQKQNITLEKENRNNTTQLIYQKPLENITNSTVEYGLSSMAETLLNLLHQKQLTIEELTQQTSFDAMNVATELILLEVQGLVKRSVGGAYGISYEE